MIFVIDTSSTRWVVAEIDEAGHGRTLIESSDRPDLAPIYEKITRPSRVAVATGPGSFTGLRVGVSFGLGIAMGLRIPIVALPSLALRAARSKSPATAVIEAGRGRVYYQVPGAAAAHGEPADVPASHPLVGDVAPKTGAALLATGHRFVPAGQLREFAAAASVVLETAREVAYGSLEIKYMQTFSAKR